MASLGVYDTDSREGRKESLLAVASRAGARAQFESERARCKLASLMACAREAVGITAADPASAVDVDAAERGPPM